MLRGQGRPVVASRQILAGGPEKVLGVTRDWAQRHPQTHRALVCALLLAQRELHAEDHSEALAVLMTGVPHIGLPVDWLRRSLTGEGVDPPSFDPADAMLRPWQMEWCLQQMVRRGQLDARADAPGAIAAVCDTDCFRDAAAITGVAADTPA